MTWKKLKRIVELQQASKKKGRKQNQSLIIDLQEEKKKKRFQEEKIKARLFCVAREQKK